jgi:Fungal specific transcription factor domain
MKEFVHLFNANDFHGSSSITPIGTPSVLQSNISYPQGLGKLPTLANLTIPNIGTSKGPHSGSASPLSQMLTTFSEEEQMGMDADGLPVIRALPVPDSAIDPQDTPYLRFFVLEMPRVLPYARLFPTAVGEVFYNGIHHTALRHSILSLSSFMADRRAKRPPTRAYMHLQKALRLLQDAISKGSIDDGVLYAVFLMVYFNIVNSDHASARRHLQGLQSLLDFRQRQVAAERTMTATLGQPFVAPALTMLIRRMAMRLDFVLAMFYARKPIFPHAEENYRAWVTLAADKNIPDAADWAAAEFGLNDILHRAAHLSYQATEMRKATTYTTLDELIIAHGADELTSDLGNWRIHRIVQNAELTEQIAFHKLTPEQQAMDDVPTRFLHYRPLHIENAFYGRLLNQYRSAQLYISLIIHPEQGPQPPDRFECAVDICRTHAALASLPQADTTMTTEIWALYLSGFAFGRSYPMECGWIKEQLAEIDRQEGYPSAKSASDFLTSILREKDSYSNIPERQLADAGTANKLLEERDVGEGSATGDFHNVLDAVNLDFGIEIDEAGLGGVTVFRPYN